MGAEVNAGTGKETTSVYSRFLDGHLERAFDVLQDMVLRPAYPDIDSERQVVIEEIAMYEDEPQDKVHDVLAGAIFGEHPLGRPIIGRADVVSSVPVPEHRGLARRALRARRDRRGRGGQRGPRAARGTGGRRLRRRAGRRGARRLPTRPTEPADRLRFHRKDTEQYHLCLGAPGHPARRRPPLRAPRMLDTILGGSTSSRLFQEVREKRGLAYSVYSYTSQYADSGQVAVYVGTRPDNVGEALDGDRHGAAPADRGRRDGGGARARPREREGPHGALDGVHLHAHEPAGELDLDGRPAADGRRGAGRVRRRHARRRGRARTRAVAARRRSWPPAWGRTRTPSAPRSTR